MLKKSLKIAGVVLAVVLIDRLAFAGAGWNLATGWMSDARESVAKKGIEYDEDRKFENGSSEFDPETYRKEYRLKLIDKVPAEPSIARAERMIGELTPVINENKHRIATEEVAVEKLGERIEKLQSRLAQERTEIMALKNHAESGERFVSFGGKAYTHEQIKMDIARRFKRYKTAEDSLQHLAKVHEARKASLDAVVQKLENMLAAKRQLVEEVANLRARLEMVRAAEAISQTQFDDSALAQVKEFVDALDTKIEVMAKLADQEADAYPEIPVGETAPEDILDQVEAHFSPTEEDSVLDVK